MRQGSLRLGEPVFYSATASTEIDHHTHIVIYDMGHYQYLVLLLPHNDPLMDAWSSGVMIPRYSVSVQFKILMRD